MSEHIHVPTDRQLLLAVRAAVTAERNRLSGDPDAAASLASADTALGVLLARNEPSELSPTPDPARASLSDLIAHEAAQAAAWLGAPTVAGADPAAIDLDVLGAELNPHLPGEGEVEITSFRRLSDGFSRETIALEVVKGGEPSELIVRVARPRGLLDGTGLSVSQEFPILRFLDASGLPVGQPLWLAPQGRALGGPYAVFRRVPGELLGTFMGGSGIGPDSVRALADLLARLHGLAWRSEASSLLPALRLPVDVGSRSEVTGLYLDRWKGYREQHGLEVTPVLAAVERWLGEHIPPDEGEPALLHGDLGFHNLLFADGQVAALLDWESAYLGSPAKDLAQLHDAVRPHAPWESFLEWYAEAGGDVPDGADIAYFQIFGGYNYLLVCEVARQSMLAQAEPNVAYVDLAFPARAHFYSELHRFVSAHAEGIPAVGSTSEPHR